jgi:hypothetical protein
MQLHEARAGQFSPLYNSAQFPMSSIKGVTQIDRSAGVIYDRGNGRVEQLLPSHDFRWQRLPSPVHRQSLEANLVCCFISLIKTYRVDGFELAAAQCEFIFGDFWRRTYFSKFEHFKLDRRDSKVAKRVVELESDTWIAALNCLKAINERRGGWQFDAPYTNIGFALTMLIFEGGILNWTVDRFGENLKLGQCAEKMRSHQQSVNKALKEGESPFPEDSFTHSFVLACLAGEDYPNLNKAWRDLLSARSKLLEHWRKISPVGMSPATGDILDTKAAIAQKKKQRVKNTRRDLM